MKAALLKTAVWAIRLLIERYVAGGLFDRVEQLFVDLMNPKFAELDGQSKRERVEEAIRAEFGHITGLAGSVARQLVELFWLRFKLAKEAD
jgi:hypothetical protein